MTKWKCPECKGTNIDVKGWIKLNQLQNKTIKTDNIELIDGGGSEDYWCNDCEQHIKPEEQE